MSDALRSIIAEFVISVDRAGEIAKGNQAVDALKKKLEGLQAAANPAARAVSDVFSRAGGSVNSFLASQGAKSLGGRSDAGGFGAAGAAASIRNAATATRAADAAAATYAGTLKGKLASAVASVRAGFSGGGSGGKGPGLIATLGTVRNGMIALGVGAAIHGVRRLVDGIGDIREGAQRLGVTTGTFQRLRVLAEQNGSSVEALGTAFRTLANSAVQPTKESTAAFAKLGVKTKDVNGQFKNTNDLFFEVAGALAEVGNETQRSALAQDVLGRSAQDLKPIFAGGRAEVDKQRKALAAMNVLSAETITQADDLSDSWKTIGPSLLVAAEPLLKLLIPGLAKLTEWLIKGVAHLGKWLKQTDFASVAITLLGAAFVTRLLPGLRLMIGLGGGVTKSLLGMAGAGAKAALSFLRMALPLLVLEDFITFLRGGDTETGRLLDAVFGKGAAEGTLKAITDMAAAFKDLWKWMVGDGQGEVVKKFFADLDEGIRLIINDLLELVGIGKGGLAGAIKGDDGKESLSARAGQWAFEGIKGTAAYEQKHRGDTIPAPQANAWAYGPPTAAGSTAGNTTFGDTILTFNGVKPGDGKAIAEDIEQVLGRNRDALIAVVQ